MSLPDQIPYRRWFPWLNLFQVIGIAASLRQLSVACGALIVLSLVPEVIESVALPEAFAVARHKLELRMAERPTDRSSALDAPCECVIRVAQPWNILLRSVAIVLGRGESRADRLLAVLTAAWHVIVWSAFGLTLCRLAARRFARGESGSFRKGVQFGQTRWTQAIVAPLIPTAAAALVIGASMLMLWPAELPWIGPSVAVVLSPVLLASSLIGGFLLIATLIGWPLMLAAIAYDDCDGFGALSRAYSQWTGRPWYFVWSWCVAACAGTIALLLADGFGQWTLHLASLVVQTSLGDTAAGQSASQSIQSMIRFLIQAYAISFFWTSATIVYALLRQSVDWMPLDHLAPDDDERPQRDPLPVVGMPAMETEQ